MEDIEDMKEEVEHKASSALSTVMKGLSAAASVGALLRYVRPYQYVNAASALRWLGLARRRSAWGTISLLGAGVVAGAAVAMFVSPMSGRETREGFLRGFRTVGKKGKELVETASHQLGEMTEGAEGGHKEREAGKEREGARRTEQKPGDKLGDKPGEGASRQAGGQSGENRPGGMGLGSSQNVGRG